MILRRTTKDSCLIRFQAINIFDSNCEFLVNTINTKGVMGAGLALEFRLRLPEMYYEYKEKCVREQIRIGEYWIYDKPNRMCKKVLNFPTKQGFNHPSKIEYIEKGLQYFRDNYRQDHIKSIAFPILGTRHGKLQTTEVLDIMKQYLADLPIEIDIHHNVEMEDKFTRRVRNIILQQSLDELEKSLVLRPPMLRKLRSQVAKITNLSDLVSTHEIEVDVMERIYDFGFKFNSALYEHSTGIEN